MVRFAKESLCQDQSFLDFFGGVFFTSAFTNTVYVPFCHLGRPDRHSSDSEITLPVSEKLIQVCVWPFELLLLTVEHKGQVCAVLKTWAPWIIKVHVHKNTHACTHTHAHTQEGDVKSISFYRHLFPSRVRQRTSVPEGWRYFSNFSALWPRWHIHTQIHTCSHAHTNPHTSQKHQSNHEFSFFPSMTDNSRNPCTWHKQISHNRTILLWDFYLLFLNVVILISKNKLTFLLSYR